MSKVKVKFSPLQALEALRVSEVEAPTFSRQSALRAGRFLPSRKIPGTHFC
jgi:hypothetical protein